MKTRYYRVKRGQTLTLIAETFCVPAPVIARENALTAEVEEGQVIAVPSERRNLYCVRGGESKTLLCGSPEAFRERNSTNRLYPGQTVFL